MSNYSKGAALAAMFVAFGTVVVIVSEIMLWAANGYCG